MVSAGRAAKVKQALIGEPEEMPSLNTDILPTVPEKT
jgi:hypothetical protein